MLKLSVCILLSALLCGCATTAEYNPVQTSQEQIFILNENELKSVRVGMTQQEAHHLMGRQITIGYTYSDSAQPITIPNPYRVKDIKTAQGACTAEYYVTAVHHPNGIVSDDELMPLVFCKGILTAKGSDK